MWFLLRHYLVRIAIFILGSMREKSPFYPLDLRYEGAVFLVLADIPSLLFFTSYTVLVLFWAEVYHFASSTFVDRYLRKVCLVFNIVVYITQVVIWVLSFVLMQQQHIILADLSFFAFVLLVSALFCMYYRGKLYLHRRQLSLQAGHDVKPDQTPRMININKVTAVTTICLALHASVIIITIYYTWLPYMYFFIVPYYAITEWLPQMLVLYVMRPEPTPTLSMAPNEKSPLVPTAIPSSLADDDLANVRNHVVFVPTYEEDESEPRSRKYRAVM
eukprot:TRINITY_DN5159_c0_g1_i1.p1 TRINITY_DN5159_c0_g1~~TRINITY_DN5159_c0_g1_i1.p1  ORF type:complete len:274 (-),score=36.17 TRINITY_DN5159_c0_g1_i1:91-912(-)